MTFEIQLPYRLSIASAIVGLLAMPLALAAENMAPVPNMAERLQALDK